MQVQRRLLCSKNQWSSETETCASRGKAFQGLSPAIAWPEPTVGQGQSQTTGRLSARGRHTSRVARNGAGERRCCQDHTVAAPTAHEPHSQRLARSAISLSAAGLLRPVHHQEDLNAQRAEARNRIPLKITPMTHVLSKSPAASHDPAVAYRSGFPTRSLFRLLRTPKQTCSPCRDKTGFLTLCGVSGNRRGLADMLMITTTVRMIHRIHCHTTRLGPGVAFDSELVFCTGCLCSICQ